jgi:hypothetical protein
MQTSDAERTSAWVVVAIGLEPILRSPHPYLSPPMPGASGEYSDRYSARIAVVGLGVDEGKEQRESSLHTSVCRNGARELGRNRQSEQFRLRRDLGTLITEMG